MLSSLSHPWSLGDFLAYFCSTRMQHRAQCWALDSSRLVAWLNWSVSCMCKVSCYLKWNLSSHAHCSAFRLYHSAVLWPCHFFWLALFSLLRMCLNLCLLDCILDSFLVESLQLILKKNFLSKYINKGFCTKSTLISVVHIEGFMVQSAKFRHFLFTCFSWRRPGSSNQVWGCRDGCAFWKVERPLCWWKRCSAADHGDRNETWTLSKEVCATHRYNVDPLLYRSSFVRGPTFNL